MKAATITIGLAAVVPLSAQEPPRSLLQDLFARVSPALVQVLGAGGIRGVPSRGTGVVLSAKGHIITFDSIALKPKATSVALADGTQVPARILARDPERGLAMLKIETKRKLSPAVLPPRGTRPGPGAPVLLTGFPFKVAGPGESASAFFGLIKARLRLDLRLRRASFPLRKEVLLTDTPVNPGSQGGGLFDLQGRLIGVAGRLVESTETNTLVSYCLPIDEVRPFLDRVMGGGGAKQEAKDPIPPPTLAGLGLKLFDFGLRSSPPAYIHRVRHGSPAARAGLRPDDLILEIAGRPVRTCAEFRLVLKRLDARQRLAFTFKRGRTVRQGVFEPPKEER